MLHSNGQDKGQDDRQGSGQGSGRVQNDAPANSSTGSSAGYYSPQEEWHDFARVDDMPEEPPVEPQSPTNRERARARGYRPAYEEPARKPANERDTAFNVLAWLVEGATGLVEELRHNDLGLSEDFWVHAAAARREGLLAARAVLDQLLEETEGQQAAERGRQQRQARRGGINVDF
jgi:hypothetical protein